MQLYYGRTISFLMIDSKIISYSSINTHYYLPTELYNLKQILKLPLVKLLEQ